VDQDESLTAFFGPVISAYTRSDAIQDGVLVDLPAGIYQEAGFTVPVAVTASVWDLIDPGNLEEMPCQSVEGRTWDLLWMCGCAARTSRGQHRSTVHFQCTFLLCEEARDGSVITENKTVTLRAVCGPGDEGEPVVTIMLPGED
jgi:hypothetical protein